MSLFDELHRVREYLNGANPLPSNEANTCNWIIWPLLLACGYSPYEIHAQGHDPAGNIPDYAILPNSAQTWFLEAKKWQEDIKDQHIVQASNYANAQGKRWFVVTNGRDWRLYDDHIIGVLPPERLVAAAKMDCEGELEALLGALSKSSVIAGNLASFARKSRLTAVLARQMAEANSEIISAIASTLRKKFGIEGVTAAEVMAYFQKPATVSNPVLPPDLAPKSPASLSSLTSPPPASKTLSLRELKEEGNGIQGRTPALLTFPDSSEKQISTWRDMTLGIVEWLLVHNKTPVLPFSGQKGGKRCLVNTQPIHISGVKMTNKPLKINGQTLYIHVNRSGPDFIRCLNALCDEVGESADGFRVKLK